MIAPRCVLVTALCMACSIGCGSSVPARFVLERDIGDHRYRRYQRMLDIEIPVTGNEATGHTATYLHSSGGRGMSVTTAFITVYTRPASLTAEVADALRTLGTYDVSVTEVDGNWVWKVEGGEEEWLVWVSSRFLVKLGAPHGEHVPEEIAETYLDLYESDLDQHGRAQSGAPSAGRSRQQREETASEMQLPDNLREGAPR